MLDTLGHYKVLDRIGAGALGEVYRARDTRLGRTVALKVPGPGLQADRDRLGALAADARAASVLSHPNVAALYEIGESEGRVFLVFEFVPGESLRRVIAGRPINVRRAVDLSTQIADALADAHALEMTHGGLTADTVMVTPKGNAKILDLGFVQWTSRGSSATTDTAADIRALGALLSEMLTGKPARPEAPSGPSIPADLTAIVARALDAGAGGYEAAATCAAELRSVAAVLDARATSGEPARVLRDRRPPSSRLWMIVAVLVALGAIAFVWRLW